MGLRNILKWPIWFAELFTTAKSFNANRIIGNRHLNRLGLHVGRMRAAHVMTAWRRLLMRGTVDPDIRRRFHRDGFVMIENFLDDEQFHVLRKEIVAFDGDLRRMMQGDTATYQGLLDEEAVARMPVTGRLLRDSAFQALMMYTGAAYKLPMFFAHCVVNGYRFGAGDPQKDFHSDTFHPTMKAWLFLDEVDAASGPFNYVPSSHWLSKARAGWEYEKSVAGRDLADTYARRGSFRIAPEELTKLGFEEPKQFVVKANTLVIADTFGFHRRGDAAPGTSRLAIYAYSRANPFNPFPALGPVTWRARIEQMLTRRALRRADATAERAGHPASWHRVDTGEIRRHAKPPPASMADDDRTASETAA